MSTSTNIHFEVPDYRREDGHVDKIDGEAGERRSETGHYVSVTLTLGDTAFTAFLHRQENIARLEATLRKIADELSGIQLEGDG